MSSTITHLTAKHIPLIAIFSALYGILRFIPFIPWIGGQGFFTLADFILPFLAILFGPYIGGSIVILGTFLGFLSGRMPFFGLDFLPALSNVLIIGFLLRRKWATSVILLTFMIVLFFIHPYTLNYVDVYGRRFPFIWMHLIAYLILLTPLTTKSVSWINNTFNRATRQNTWYEQWLTIIIPISMGFIIIGYASPLQGHLITFGIENSLWGFLLSGFIGAVIFGVLGGVILLYAKRSRLMVYTTIAVAILSFIGSLTQHIMGNLLFATISIILWGMTPPALMDMWKAIFIVYPFERIIIILISTIFCLFLIPPIIRSRMTRFLITYR